MVADANGWVVVVDLVSFTVAFLFALAALGMQLLSWSRIRLSAQGWRLPPRLIRNSPALRTIRQPLARTDREGLARSLYTRPVTFAYSAAVFFAYSYVLLLESIILIQFWPDLRGLTAVLLVAPLPILIFVPLLIAWLETIGDQRGPTVRTTLRLLKATRHFTPADGSHVHRLIIVAALRFMSLVRKLGVPEDDNRIETMRKTIADTGRRRQEISQLPDIALEVLVDIFDGRFHYTQMTKTRSRTFDTNRWITCLKLLAPVFSAAVTAPTAISKIVEMLSKNTPL